MGEYASVNGLDMYFEIHGAGRPLVLLHGGAMTIGNSFPTLLPTLAETRQVIAVEQQGHGHTADIDRPLSFEQMVEDTAAFLRQRDVVGADVLGYSDGGIVALGLAIRHPDLVRKLVPIGAIFENDGLNPEDLEFFAQASPESFGDRLREDYERVAPRPGDWPNVIAKLLTMWSSFTGWRREDLQAIQAPALFVIGDADLVRPEHAVEMFRLLPHANLAVLPRSEHDLIVTRVSWLLSMLPEFLDAPMPEGQDNDAGDEMKTVTSKSTT
jgi:pimeloyl-ACP methyl ester carboxylesterase